MLGIGVQTKNVVYDNNPQIGFDLLKNTGFTCADFSLNSYLTNTDLYDNKLNLFFGASIQELEAYFTPHRRAAEKSGIAINQMHMPYPVYIPAGKEEVNRFLREEAAPKSMMLCSFFRCPYIVIHGLKLVRFLGAEEAEWEQTKRFLDSIAPLAKELEITICMENLYDSVAGHLVEGPGCDARKAVERIDRMNEAYGAEVLGFCLDTGHANLVGLDMEQFIVTLGSRLKVLHIHDNDGISDLHQIPYTFTRTRENVSSTDWDGFLAGLKKIHFNGTLSFETAPVLSSFPEEMKEETLRFIAKIGCFFREKIEA